MKKYKLLEHIDNEEWEEIGIWDIFEIASNDYFTFSDWKTCPISFLIREWYIEEIKEQLPKFKVWDYVVWNKHTSFSWDIYIKIHSIHTIDNEFAYNFEKFRENNLRLPTEEELKKYFR